MDEKYIPVFRGKHRTLCVQISVATSVLTCAEEKIKKGEKSSLPIKHNNGIFSFF